MIRISLLARRKSQFGVASWANKDAGAPEGSRRDTQSQLWHVVCIKKSLKTAKD